MQLGYNLPLKWATNLKMRNIRLAISGTNLLTITKYKGYDPEAINNRSEIFKYFQSKQISFPFSDEEFSLMENYLSGSSGGNYPVTLLTLAKKKLLAAVVRDEEYPKIH